MRIRVVDGDLRTYVPGDLRTYLPGDHRTYVPASRVHMRGVPISRLRMRGAGGAVTVDDLYIYIYIEKSRQSYD